MSTNGFTSPRLLCLFTLLGSACLIPQAQAVSFDFSDPDQYSDNFFRTRFEPGSGATFGQDDSLDLLKHTSGGSALAVFVYDTSPDGTPTNTFGDVSVSFDFSTTATGSPSFGIYFGGSSRTNAALALFNFNASGATDTLRFFTGANLTTGSAGTLFSTKSTTGTDPDFVTGTTYHASLSISYVTATTANVTYTISDPVNLTSFSATATGMTIASAGEIAFRSSFQATAQNTFDNISITAIPEPSTYAFLGGAAVLGFGLLRRRRV